MPEYITADLSPLSSVRISQGLSVFIDEENHLILETKDTGQKLETTPEEISLPQIWDRISFIVFDVRLISGEFKGSIRIVGAKRALSYDVSVEEDTKELKFPLKELPLATESHDAFRVKNIEFLVESVGAIELLNIRIASEEVLKQAPLIDQYGQRINAEWPTKINGNDDFQERKQLDASKAQPPHAISQFGGWSGDIKFTGSGHFKLGKTSSGRWWLIDPDGFPFWSFGIGQIGLNLKSFETLYNGREQIFANEIESQAESLKVNHYKVNCLHKYGDESSWVTNQKERLKHWGVNTIGMHSEYTFFEDNQTPIVISLPAIPEHGDGIVSNWPDVFCPNWQEWFQENVPEMVMEWTNTPNLLAYQVGRMLPWDNARILDSEADSAVKAAWRDFMEGKYKDISAFNEVWQSNYSDWDNLLNMSELNIPRERNEAEKDKAEFLYHYAEEYFKLLSNLVTSLDEKHLLLGPCFGPELPAENILKLAGEHFDVICWLTGNEPLSEETLKHIFELTGRPILLCGASKERIFKNSLHSNTKDYSVEQLTNEYRKDISLALRLPYVLGYHFDSLVDDPISGRIIDDERRNVGVVDIADTPYSELVDTIRELTENLYKERLKAN